MDAQDIAGTTRTSELPAFLQPLLERMHSSANAETVFGPSRAERGRTIVPVARVAYGLGGGFGSAANEESKEDAGQSRPDQGAGGGGGITVTPLGVLEVTDDRTRFVPLTRSKVVAVSTFVAGLLFGMLLGRSSQR